MLWVIEESDDCGVHWQRAELTYCYWHPRIAMLEALEISGSLSPTLRQMRTLWSVAVVATSRPFGWTARLRSLPW
jgi:hypothetical protein